MIGCHEDRLSRRSMLTSLTYLACAVPIAVLAKWGDARAQNKLSKEQARYQDEPKEAQKCSNCKLFLPDQGACTLVEGDINAEAWCALWTAES